MKVALIFLLVVGLAQFNVSQDLPENEDSMLRCIVDGAQATAGHVVGGAVWIANTTRIAIELLIEYRRCQDMTSTIQQNICMTSWGVSAVIAANQVRRDLAAISTEEIADGFYYHFLSCLGINTPPPPEYMKY